MFGLGTKKTSEEPPSAIPVSAMPAEFYGGANPTVTFKAVTKEVEIGDLTPGEKKAFDRATAPGRGQPFHPVNLFTNRRFIIIAGVVLFVFFTGGVSWYYIRQAEPPPPPATPAAPPAVPAPAVEEPPVIATTTVEATSTPPAAETPTTTPAVTGLIEFPSLVLGSSPDSDRDGLSSPEEELFKTDPAAPDTDGDGYRDGSEVFHLYNPIGKEPQKLIDSGLVKEFVNPVFNYRLYYPTTWAVGNVDQNYRDVLFSTLTGENIEVKVSDIESGLPLADWFNTFAPTENVNTVTNYASVFKEPGLRRPDGLVFYFPRPNQIVAVVYHPAMGETVVNYRSVVSLMAQSFRWPGNGVAIPAPAPAVVFDTTNTVTVTPVTAPVPATISTTSTQGTF
ncbi:MAG: hypothetical protein HY983_01745 [Candidatus Magasanikbacteria bacterium]|nr:hypothetical protein [Candidatus Magasanikbacteria bacterium]